MITIEVDKYKISLTSTELKDLEKDLRELFNHLVNSDMAIGYPSSVDYIVASYPGLAALMKAFNVLLLEDDLPF